MSTLPSLSTASSAFTPVPLTPETPPLTCARRLILERAQEMVKFEAGTRKGEDLEALHDMRVWSRRLREAFEIFVFCFPEKVYNKLYERVRQVTKTLGKAREADVAVEFFTQLYTAAQDTVERFALEDLLSRLVETQTHERARMQSKLDRKVQPSALPEELTLAFERLAAQPASRQRGPRTALRLTRTLLLQRLRTVFALRQALTGEDDVNGLHNLRIAVKKLRYALEILHFAAGNEMEANLKFFKKLQAVLGEIHDRDVFIAEVKARYDALHQRAFSATLLQGYEQIFQHLLQARRGFYEEYVKLFGEAKLAEWQKRVVPPLPPRGQAADRVTKNRNASNRQTHT
ncbi:MAG: CHAD domain-containing protein [candidate division KSB1 bacterium]